VEAPADRLSERRRVRDGLLLEDGRRLGDVMDAWQREDFEALDDPRYRHAYLERPRGHSKTGDVGTEACVELLTGAPGQQLFCIAADEDQGRILLDDVKGKLIRGGHLKAKRVRILKNSIISSTGSVLKVLTADVASSWGLRPDWVACDEIVEWRSEALWESLYTATGKRPHCRLLVISTAGWDTSHFAWAIRTKIAEPEPDWYFSSRGQCASWIDPAWLAQQRRTLPAHVYARLHENKWVDGVGAFLTTDEVDAIFTGEIPAAGGRMAIGLDVGLTKDRTVLSLVRATADGLLVVDGLETWQGSRGAKVDLTEVEEAAYSASRQFHAPIWLDPFQAVQMAQHLRTRGRQVHEYAVTSESRRRLFGMLLKAVRDRTLRCQFHEELRKELLGLEVKETLAGFRVDHKVGRFDDHVFAVALGIAGALEHRPGFALVWSSSQTTVERAQAFYTRRAQGAPLTTGRNQADEYRRHLIRCQDPRACGNHPAHAAPPPATPALSGPSRVIDDDRGLHLVTTPIGQVEVYQDPRGLGPEEPYEPCPICGRGYP
jgi:hypothetical protein